MGEETKTVMGSRGGGKSSVVKGSSSSGKKGGMIGGPQADKSVGTKAFMIGKRGLKTGRGM